MCSHRGLQWTPFVDVEEMRTFAIGVCVHCRQQVLMTCSCGETFMVLRGVLVCDICDCLGNLVCQLTQQSINETTCESTDRPDETER